MLLNFKLNELFINYYREITNTATHEVSVQMDS